MSADLTITDDQREFTPKQVAVLSQIGVQDASPEDLAVFFHQAQRTGLDPFARQIYMIGRRQKRWNPETRQEVWETKQTIQTGIDGFRLIARRAADAAKEPLSISQPYFATREGKWLDFWPFDYPPVAAKVLVKRGGGEFPAVAMFNEYAGTTGKGGLTRMWQTKPTVMIGKCAEALALRKAFPMDLSGLYTAEEMDQATEEVPAPQVQPEPQPEVPLAPQELMDEISAYAKELNLTKDQVLATAKYCGHDGTTPTPTLEVGQAMADYLKRRRDEAAAKRADAQQSAESEEIVDAEIVEEPATRPQLQKLNILMEQALGSNDRDAKLNWLSARLNREVVSSKDLTKAEASTAIEDLLNPPEAVS